MNNTQWIIIAIGFQTAILLVAIYKSTKKTGSDYDRGREWACEQYYCKGRHTSWIRRTIETNTQHDEFDRGAFVAIQELERREAL